MINCEFISDIKLNSHSPIFDVSPAGKSIRTTQTLASVLPRGSSIRSVGVAWALTGPIVPGFAENDSNVLGTFFHLACEVHRRGHDEVWICPPDFHFRVEAFDVHVRRCYGLLAEVNGPFRKLRDFWRSVS